MDGGELMCEGGKRWSEVSPGHQRQCLGKSQKAEEEDIGKLKKKKGK